MAFADLLKNRNNGAATGAAVKPKIDFRAMLAKRKQEAAGEAQKEVVEEKKTEAAETVETVETTEAPVKEEMTPAKLEAKKSASASIKEKALAAAKAAKAAPKDEELKEIEEEIAQEKAEAENKENEASDDKAETEETKTEEQEVKAETPEPEKKKATRKVSKRKTSKKTAKTEDSADDEDGEEQNMEAYDLLPEKFSFNDMAGAIIDYFLQDEWQDTQDEYINRLANIRIAADMNPATLKYALEEIHNLYDDAAVVRDQMKQLLTLAKAGAEVREVVYSHGSNSDERKKSAFKALATGELNGQKVNYILAKAVATAKYEFMSAFCDRVLGKSKACLTMLGCINAEERMELSA